MKKRVITDAADRQLITAAKRAARRAYAPYSGFRVGAALLTKSGRIFTGCNVENASYGLTICAERTAIFKAVSEGRKRFLRMAICSLSDELPMPCGACRQVMAEFAPNLEVIVADKTGCTRAYLLKQLLPEAF